MKPAIRVRRTPDGYRWRVFFGGRLVAHEVAPEPCFKLAVHSACQAAVECLGTPYHNVEHV